MKIEDLEIYNRSMDYADKVWKIVVKWDYFAKDTVGKQWVRACDSVSANISEGFGRYTSKDSMKFYIIARGSMQEHKTWLSKAFRRGLVSEDEFKTLSHEWEAIYFKLMNFIKVHSKSKYNK